MNVSEYFDVPGNLQKLNEKYDVFVIESDQVWACELNYYDNAYFLNFVDGEHKRISYAASFGWTVNTLQDEEKSIYDSFVAKI